MPLYDEPVWPGANPTIHKGIELPLIKEPIIPHFEYMNKELEEIKMKILNYLERSKLNPHSTSENSVQADDYIESIKERTRIYLWALADHAL